MAARAIGIESADEASSAAAPTPAPRRAPAPEVDSLAALRVAQAVDRLLVAGAVSDIEDAYVDLRARREPPRGPRIRFAFASCQYPAGMLVESIAHASYQRLREHAEGPRPPRALLLLGDQIYTDATAGLFDPSDADARDVKPYERLFRIPALRWLLRHVPTFMMLDDHELIDNWEPAAGNATRTDRLDAGRSGYLKYQRSAGPPRSAARGDSAQPLWYPFEVDGLSFFMADTRTERRLRMASTVQHARMISHAQWVALRDWLLALHRGDGEAGFARPKFICSPAMLIPRRLRAHEGDQPAAALRTDAWDGYPRTLHRLLALLADQGIGNVIFLSGDEHLACIATAQVVCDQPGARPVTIRSWHSPALFAPYPFANSQAAEFAERDSWYFDDNQEPGATGLRYRCDVQATFPGEANGFGLVDVDRDTGVADIDYSLAGNHPV